MHWNVAAIHFSDRPMCYFHNWRRGKVHWKHWVLQFPLHSLPSLRILRGWCHLYPTHQDSQTWHSTSPALFQANCTLTYLMISRCVHLDVSESSLQNQHIPNWSHGSLLSSQAVSFVLSLLVGGSLHLACHGSRKSSHRPLSPAPSTFSPPQDL